MNKIKLGCVLFFAVFGTAALFVDNSLVPAAQSFSGGPPIGFTGGPDEQSCTVCHEQNAGSGVFTINAPANYVPGQTYQLQVQHATTDATRLRWGFEMTAMDGTNVGAGTFASTDGFTSTDIDNSNMRSYVLHTSSGTFPGTSNGASWTFDWTAPATNVGPVTFYASGNQANNNNNSDGDIIYLTNVVTQPAGPTPTNTATSTATSTNTPTPTPTCYTVTTLSGTEEVPPNGSAGTGTGTVSVNAAQTQITVTLTWSGLSSNANAAHIHGPAAAGSSAGVLFGMAGVPSSPSGSISPASQTFAISPAQLTQFQNGLFYWNLHSATFGGGEIRGQILPGPCLATPTATATATATNTPTATPTNTPSGADSVAGTVRYGNPASPTTKFISNATVTATGSVVFSTTTAAPGGTAGQYTLTGFGSGNYTVSVTKTTGQNGISAGDASRTAQHSAGILVIPSAGQRIAADATGNGSITAGDASQIARFAAGLGAGTAITNQWRFYVPNPTFPVGASPTTRPYTDPIGVQTGQDFIGILVGEVTGNWVAGSLRPAGNHNGQEAAEDSITEPRGTIAVNVPELAAQPNADIVMPVNVEGVAGEKITSYEFDLRYDPSVIQPLADPVDVAGTVSRGLFVVTNAEMPGLLRVVVYGSMPIDENGLLLNFRFTAVGTPGSVSPLSFERMMFNEGEIDVIVTESQLKLS